MSNYPNKIDTSIELPVVRNNVTELSADIINRLRSAILNIEMALGTNINGEKRSLSERISESIDGNGNLKESAISHLNIITGKILDSDVSSAANISESKLDLEYSTKYLKSQILSVNSDIESLLKTINDYTALIKIHIDKSSKNAHNAGQIDLVDSSNIPSTTTNKIIQDEDLQLAFQRVYNEHINLSPDRITESNNSHSSEQIYYNNDALNQKSIYSVKEVLDHILAENSLSELEAFANITENGVVSFGNVKDDTQEFKRKTIISNELIQFSNSFNQEMELKLINSKTAENVEVGDIAYISKPDGISFVETYVTDTNYLAGSQDELISVFVKNNIDFEYSGTISLTIVKSGRAHYNPNGLRCSFRSYSNNSSNSSAYIENPNSAFVISQDIDVATAQNKNITIEYEGGSFTVDVFNASGPQSIEYIVHALNIHFCDNNIPISCSEISTDSGREICISHILPNMSIFSKRPYIKIKEASEKDFSILYGFSNSIDRQYFGANENASIINGSVLKNIFSPEDISSFCTISSGSRTISISESAQIETKIRKRNLIYIEHEGSGAGIFDIRDVIGTEIFFLNDKTFNFDSSPSTKFYILRNNTSSESITYSGSSSSIDKSMLVEIMASEDGTVIKNKILESVGIPYVSSSSGFISQVRVVDMERKNISSVTTSITMTSQKYCNITYGSLSGALIYCPITGFYKIPFPDGDGYIEIYFITSPETMSSDISISIEMFKKSGEGLLHLSNVLFSETLSYFSAPRVYSNINVAFSKDKRNFGVIGSEQISNRFKSEELHLPRSENTYNFVVNGFEATATPDFIGGFFEYDVSISKGVCYINGKRIFSKERTVTVKFYSGIVGAIIYIDSYGEMSATYYTNKISTFLPEDYLPLYAIQPFSTDYFRTDAPDSLCKKIFVTRNQESLYPRKVTVGSRGNFRSIGDAIRYFDAIYEIFEDQKLSCEIFLDNEEHIIDSQIELGQYSIKFIGGGDNSTVRISNSMENNNPPGTYGFSINNGCFRIRYTDKESLICNIKFENVKFDYTNITSTGVYSIVIIGRSSSFSGRKLIKFQGCSFLGSENVTNANNSAGVFIIPFSLLPESSESDPKKYIGDLSVENCFFRKTGDMLMNGPVFFIGHFSSPDTVPVDNIILKGSIFENCSVGDLQPFFNGSIVTDFSLSSVVTLTKNLISLNNKEYYSL